MSITTTIDICCDGKNCREWVWGHTATCSNIKMARLQVKEVRTWKFEDGKDYCPECFKKLRKTKDEC